MERHDEFFRRSYEELQKVFEDCLIDGMVHKDEVHTYIDPTTKTERISLEHMHIVGVPFTETNEENENKIAKYAQDTLDHTIEIKTYEK